MPLTRQPPIHQVREFSSTQSYERLTHFFQERNSLSLNTAHRALPLLWTGAVSQKFGAAALLHPVKGSHIVVPRLYSGQHALLLQNRDGRVVFCIPYRQHYTLIGTTDESFDGDPAQVTISTAETQYLCDAISRYFSQPVTPADVVWSYAGVRPLWDDAGQNNSKVTRDYRLELINQPGPLLNVFGGKILTRYLNRPCSAEACLPAARRQNAAVVTLQPVLITQSAGRHASACPFKF